jgi:hypothetical protein
MLNSFEPLWERLLQGGVARRPARRYIAELRDHLDDLIAEERQAAGDEREARSRALTRLGSIDALAGAMIARREVLAWGRKAPVATYVIAPAIALAACTALAMAGVVMTATWLRTASGGAANLPSWSLAMAADVVFFSNGLLAVLLGWALGVMATRERSAPLWPVLRIVVLATVGGALQLEVTLPSAIGHGEIDFAGGGWGDFLGRVAHNLVLMLAPYAAIRLWRAVRSGRSDCAAASETPAA